MQEGVKPKYPEKHPWSKKGTNDKLNPHNYDTGLESNPDQPRPHRWEASALTSAPTLLPNQPLAWQMNLSHPSKKPTKWMDTYTVCKSSLFLCYCIENCSLECNFVLQADVDNDIKLLTQKNEEISEVVTKLEANSDNLDIDEAVVTTAPLYNQ